MDPLGEYPFENSLDSDGVLNNGNIVLVLQHNGEWWLGYVQDVDGENLFVNFGSTTSPACWMHSRQVWPHPLMDKSTYSIDKEIKENGSFMVRVALRREDHGPWAVWDEELLATACEEYYLPGKLLLSSDVLFFEQSSTEGSVCDEDCGIFDLSLDVLAEILYSTDLHTQARLVRVCPQWWEILADHEGKRHITVDIRRFIPWSHTSMYRLAWCMDHKLTRQTETVTLIDLSMPRDLVAGELFLHLQLRYAHVRWMKVQYRIPE
ncbi:uncharacterized protein LOC129599130 [Paramacrobiotus metropolitanus]|uniref:uncharacterized protein LOC129599130 n=1 Tax=Paramacrobiotus metropolitanus TaxID=2943436 RepID=UPI002445FEEE|nr:uncharacterized protein LOC129599130 [Paramacrobiotus metropolitanus]